MLVSRLLVFTWFLRPKRNRSAGHVQQQPLALAASSHSFYVRQRCVRTDVTICCIRRCSSFCSSEQVHVYFWLIVLSPCKIYCSLMGSARKIATPRQRRLNKSLQLWICKYRMLTSNHLPHTRRAEATRAKLQLSRPVSNIEIAGIHDVFRHSLPRSKICS